MKFKLFFALAFLFSTGAHAWDCNYWYQSTDPKGECYRAPGTQGANMQNISTATAAQKQQQAQAQLQGQHQSSSNVNRNAASSASAARSNSAANAVNGGNTLATTTSTVNSGNYVESAQAVQPPTMIIQGCQVQGIAGGSSTRAAGMLGIGFTPKNCYDYMQAQAYLAIGATQAACEILNHTEAAQRAVKNGAKLPDCGPSPAVVPAGPYVTQEELQALVKRGLVK